MDKIKTFLEKYPRLNKIVRAVYIPPATKFIEYKLHLRRNRLGEWWIKRGDSWAKELWKGRDHPHRSFLVERIAAFSPISSILEIGCTSGPNLYLLAKRFPDAEIRGMEINCHAVEVGNEGFSREGISNVKIFAGRAEDLSEFKDKSIDVILTDAVLIYVAPGNIQGILKEMVRVARKGLVLVERHAFEKHLDNKHISEAYIKGLWVRDYVALLKQYIPEGQIRVTKITEDIWPPDGWGGNGALIEASLI